MARAPNPKLEKAYELFKKGYRLVDISNELDIPVGTIRSWKNRNKWDEGSNATLQKKKESNKQCNVAKEKNDNKHKKKKTVAKEVIEVLENEELNDKQKLFCVIYAKCLNATKAYLKVYHCTYETAMVEGSRNLKKPKIREQIDKLIAPEINREFLKRGLLQKYLDIAFSDIGEYVKFGRKIKNVWTKDKDDNDIPVVDPDTGQQKQVEYNYLELRESTMVDTTLISEISEGKDGIKIKLVDKMKAMDFLSKHANLLKDEEKIKLDIEYKRLQNAKLGAEIDRINGDNESEEYEEDGFIEALNSTAKDLDWSDEEDN